MSVRELKVKKSHILILCIQLALACSLYLLILPFNKIVAMGIMVCALCPTASSAPAMVKMLGGDVSYVAIYLLLVNLVMAIVIPFTFSWVMNNDDIAFAEICFGIMKRVAALLLIPLLLARIIKHLHPKTNQLLIKYSNITFYIWAVALVIAIANTIRFFKTHNVENSTLGLMAAASLFICLLQFGIGRLLGVRFSNKVAVCQTVGQKNTILAIWMSQTFLNPISSIIPAWYILWQNILNSVQLSIHRRKSSDK